MQTAQELGARPVLAIWLLTTRSWTSPALALSRDEMQKVKRLETRITTRIFSDTAFAVFSVFCHRSVESNLTSLRSWGPAHLPNLVSGRGPIACAFCSGIAQGETRGWNWSGDARGRQGGAVPYRTLTLRATVPTLARWWVRKGRYRVLPRVLGCPASPSVGIPSFLLPPPTPNKLSFPGPAWP